jgi:hypothetical protein
MRTQADALDGGNAERDAFIARARVLIRQGDEMARAAIAEANLAIAEAEEDAEGEAIVFDAEEIIAEAYRLLGEEAAV